MSGRWPEGVAMGYLTNLVEARKELESAGEVESIEPELEFLKGMRSFLSRERGYVDSIPVAEHAVYFLEHPEKIGDVYVGLKLRRDCENESVLPKEPIPLFDVTPLASKYNAGIGIGDSEDNFELDPDAWQRLLDEKKPDSEGNDDE